MLLTDDLIARARRVRLFLCDVDGVLTETNVIMGGGIESKTFHIRDGLGLRLLQSEAAIRVGWISARQSHATSMRAADLQVDFLRQSATPKVEVIEALLSECCRPRCLKAGRLRHRSGRRHFRSTGLGPFRFPASRRTRCRA